LDEVENPSILKTGRSHPNTPLPAPLAAAPYRASDLVLWTRADILTALNPPGGSSALAVALVAVVDVEAVA
jgi:hypothetical protein